MITKFYKGHNEDFLCVRYAIIVPIVVKKT